jgi:putative NADH-flavin reductase
MKIAIIGATGFSGSKIRDEALKRGHGVTAIGRHINKLPQHKNLVPHKIDSYEDVNVLAEAFKGQDAVITAIHFEHVDGKKILEALKKAGVKRLLVTGGASSLEVSPGMMQQDIPEFQAFIDKIGASESASTNYEFFKLLQNENDLDWSYLSPQNEFIEGEAQGNVRMGKDEVLQDKNGRSYITNGDFAVAMIDELEKPKHTRERFTVGY